MTETSTADEVTETVAAWLSEYATDIEGVEYPVSDSDREQARELLAAIVPMLRESIAGEIEAARDVDRKERAEMSQHGEDEACEGPHAQCHASAAYWTFDTAARIARGASR